MCTQNDIMCTQGGMMMAREDTHAQVKVWVEKEKYEEFKRNLKTPERKKKGLQSDVSKFINQVIDEFNEQEKQRKKYLM